MRSRLSPTLAFPIASALVLALSSCGNPGTRIPPAADLRPAPEPRLDPNAVTNDSAAALDAYDAEHEAWGRGEHGKVSRLCQWFKDVYGDIPALRGLDCAPE